MLGEVSVLQDNIIRHHGFDQYDVDNISLYYIHISSYIISKKAQYSAIVPCTWATEA